MALQGRTKAAGPEAAAPEATAGPQASDFDEEPDTEAGGDSGSQGARQGR